MGTMKIVWKRPEGVLVDFVPPLRFWNNKGIKTYSAPKRVGDNKIECLVDDNIQNREYVEAALTWTLLEEDVIIRRQKIAEPTPFREPKTRGQMQQEMDEAQYNYSKGVSGGLLSDKKIADEYQISASVRSRAKKKKQAEELLIFNGQHPEQLALAEIAKQKAEANGTIPEVKETVISTLEIKPEIEEIIEV